MSARRNRFAVLSIPSVLFVCGLLAPAACAAVDLARGKVWRWTRPPNYARCTDARDSLQLSDGRRAPNEYLWLDMASVGWELQAGDAVGFVIDLGVETSVDSVIVRTTRFPPSGVFPPSLVCAAGANTSALEWRGSLDARTLPPGDASKPQRIDLVLPVGTAARTVLLTALANGSFLIVDEIEIRGPGRGRASAPGKPQLTARAGPLGRPFTAAEIPALHTAQRRVWAMRAALPQAAVSATMDARAEEAARLADRATRWRRAGAPALTVRRVDPWKPATPWSDLQATVAADTIWVWPGAWSAAAIEIAVADAAPRTVALALEPPVRGAPIAVLREVLAVESRDGVWALDALPRAPESLRIDPGSVRQVWIDIDATAAQPGVHAIVARVGDQRVQVPVRVVDRRVGPQPIGAIDWTYPTKMGLLRGAPAAAVQDNVAHGVDTWCLPYESVPWPDRASIGADGRLSRPPDFTVHDQQLALYPIENARRIGWYLHFDANRNDPSHGRFGHAWMSPAWQRAFGDWLDAWLAHLKKRGIDRERLFLQLFDETTAPRAEELYVHLRQTRPELRLMLTLTRGATPASLQRFGDAIRMPIMEREAVPQHTAWIESMRKRGAEVWTYDVIEPSKTAAPGRDYRGLAWDAWSRGLAGCGFWSYGDTGEEAADAWNDHDAARNDFAVVYGATGAPRELGEDYVPSKRWQAFRIGMQETALFEAALKKRPQLRGEIAAALAGGDVDYDGWRRRLLAGR